MPEVYGSFTVSETLFASGPWSVACVSGPDGRSARLTVLQLPTDLSGADRAGLASALEQAAAAHRDATPALPAVLASGEADGRLWLVESAPTGHSVRETVAAGGPMSAEQVIPLLHQIGAALETLHAAGQAHAWLSPDNIYLEPSALVAGQPWSLVAATLAVLCPGAPWPESAYLAPEARAGSAPDARAEVFSAAALAVFAITGQEPSPRVSLDGLPPTLATALLGCFNADPGARPTGVKALAVDVTVERAIAMQDAADQVAVPSGGDVPDWARDLLRETSARRDAGQPIVETAAAEPAPPAPAAPAPPFARQEAAPAARSFSGPMGDDAPRNGSAAPPAHPAETPREAASLPPLPDTSRGFDWNAQTTKGPGMSVILAVVSILFILAAIAVTILK